MRGLHCAKWGHDARVMNLIHVEYWERPLTCPVESLTRLIALVIFRSRQKKKKKTLVLTMFVLNHTPPLPHRALFPTTDQRICAFRLSECSVHDYAGRGRTSYHPNPRINERAQALGRQGGWRVGSSK